MTSPERIREEELCAYLDGELPAARAEDLSRALEADPDLAERLAAFAADRDRLATLYAPVEALPLPVAWLERIAAETGAPVSAHPIAVAAPPAAANTNLPRLLALAAAACLALALGTVLRPVAPGPAGADKLIAEALAAPLRTAPATALPRIAGNIPRAPDLSARGWQLAATRADARGPAVLFEYRDKTGRRFALYLRPSPGAPRFEMALKGDTRICIWQDDAITAVMTGALPAGEMMRLATAAYAALEG